MSGAENRWKSYWAIWHFGVTFAHRFLDVCGNILPLHVCFLDACFRKVISHISIYNYKVWVWERTDANPTGHFCILAWRSLNDSFESVEIDYRCGCAFFMRASTKWHRTYLYITTNNYEVWVGQRTGGNPIGQFGILAWRSLTDFLTSVAIYYRCTCAFLMRASAKWYRTYLYITTKYECGREPMQILLGRDESFPKIHIPFGAWGPVQCGERCGSCVLGFWV